MLYQAIDDKQGKFLGLAYHKGDNCEAFKIRLAMKYDKKRIYGKMFASREEEGNGKR